MKNRFHRECLLARSLFLAGFNDVFSGVTHAEEIKERIRAAILTMPAKVIAKTKAGRDVTAAQGFESVYGEPLHVKPHQEFLC